MRRTRDSNVQLELADHPQQSKSHDELVAFARYCVVRIERELGAIDRWSIRVALSAGGGYTTTIAVCDSRYETEVVTGNRDGALAIWDAMCRVEQRLREARYAEGARCH